MSRFKTQFNPTYKGSPGTTYTQPSQTCPDMNLTVKQLLINHTRGIPSNVKIYDPQYFEDQEIPNFVDKTELHDYTQSLKSTQIDLEDQIREEQRLQSLSDQKNVNQSENDIKTTQKEIENLNSRSDE